MQVGDVVRHWLVPGKANVIEVCGSEAIIEWFEDDARHQHSFPISELILSEPSKHSQITDSNG